MKKESCKLYSCGSTCSSTVGRMRQFGSSTEASGSKEAREASPRHRIRGARTEAVAEQRERFQVRLRSGIHLPRAKTGDHPEGGRQIYGRKPGCENQY